MDQQASYMKMVEDVLPIRSLQDFSHIPQKARIQVALHSPKDYYADTIKKTVHRSGNLPMSDLTFDIQGVGDITLNSIGAPLDDETCCLSEAATCLVNAAEVRYGSAIICNDTELKEWFKWVSTQQIDNEDESLNVYCPSDEGITANTTATFATLCFQELTAEALK